ncbi:MAG: hypothetical protein JXR10_09665 [Cyclobacteriaceae bacterium]
MKKLSLILLVFGIWSCGDSNGDIEVSEDFRGEPIGIGGSTARFTIYQDYLYIVNDTELKAVDIADADDPILSSTTNLGGGIETIYGYKGNLFIGSQFGMQIFGIAEDGSPFYQSEFRHQTACDPVIANSEYAYVTIRSGIGCNNSLFPVDQLIVLDVTDLRNPFEVHREQMINPRGLAFFKGDLFVAEGNNGLKQYNLDDPAHPALIEFHQDIAANDMIALENTMIITRDEGIFQFGCEEEDIILFSTL